MHKTLYNISRGGQVSPLSMPAGAHGHGSIFHNPTQPNPSFCQTFEMSWPNPYTNK